MADSLECGKFRLIRMHDTKGEWWQIYEPETDEVLGCLSTPIEIAMAKALEEAQEDEDG